MFSYIHGNLTELSVGAATVEAAGVGYALTISQATHGKLARLPENADTKLYTYLSIREDGVELFGFADREELMFFKMLIGVSGVGPKAALSILSSLSISELIGAIVTDRPKVLAAAPGIGTKTASRIIIDLKDKLAGSGYTPTESTAAPAAPIAANGSKLLDAESALEVLGYSRNEIQASLQGVDVGKMSVEDIIRICISKMT